MRLFHHVPIKSALRFTAMHMVHRCHLRGKTSWGTGSRHLRAEIAGSLSELRVSSHAILRAVIIEILQVTWRHWDRLERHIWLLLWSLADRPADDPEVSHLTVHIATS